MSNRNLIAKRTKRYNGGGRLKYVTLSLTLGEMYNGCVKCIDCKVQICDFCTPSNSQNVNSNQQYSTCLLCRRVSARKVTMKKSIIIPRGTRPRQEIFYAPKSRTGDRYILIIEALDHPIFQLHGDNLFMTMPLELVESLCGFQREITTLDNRKLSVGIPAGVRVIPDDNLMCIKNEGMTKYKKENRRGDLIIRFVVVMPDKIAYRFIPTIKQILPPPPPKMEISLEAEERNLSDFPIPSPGHVYSEYELLEEDQDYEQFDKDQDYEQFDEDLNGIDRYGDDYSTDTQYGYQGNDYDTQHAASQQYFQ